MVVYIAEKNIKHIQICKHYWYMYASCVDLSEMNTSDFPNLLFFTIVVTISYKISKV